MDTSRQGIDSNESFDTKPKVRSYDKIMAEELAGRVDSGYGDSLVSHEGSIIDRSSCESFSHTDKSRHQVFEDNDLVQKTSALKIDKRPRPLSFTSQSHTSDEGYSTLDTSESHATTSGSWMNFFTGVQRFSQTNDSRHLLANVWPLLLAQNEDGDTCLHVAIINCQEPVVFAILDVLPRNSLCLDIYNDLSQTPLHLAVITRQPKIVRRLIDQGARIDISDRNGQTCVHLACQRGDLKSLKAICWPRPQIHGFQETLCKVFETRNFDGLAPLSVAAKGGHLEVVEELIKLEVNVDAMDGKSGYTALHFSVELCNLLMVSCLLFKGKANPNAQSFSGSTPLHLATGLQLDTIAATLVAVGADTAIENIEGDTPYNIANEINQDFSLENLEEMAE